MISIWTDPDTTDDGSPGGQFWVRLHVAGKGAVIPDGTRVMVGIRPARQPAAERTAAAAPVRGDATNQFAALAMDHEGRFAVHVAIDGPLGLRRGRHSRRHLQRSALAVDAGALSRAVPAHRTVMGPAAVAAKAMPSEPGQSNPDLPTSRRMRDRRVPGSLQAGAGSRENLHRATARRRRSAAISIRLVIGPTMNSA